MIPRTTASSWEDAGDILNLPNFLFKCFWIFVVLVPEDWDYTLAGLSQINREKIDAIREAIKELERAGYIVRSRERDEKGRLRGADYVIYEQPHTEPTPDLPTLENPTLDNPMQEKPMLEKPTLENPMQLNKDIQRTDLPTKEKRNTDLQSTHSIPILSPNPSPLEQEAATPPERKRKEAEAQTAFEIYREIIKDNIDYDILMQDMKFDGDRLNEIVDLMLETVCTRRKTIRIAGDDYPAELVKAKFMKLDAEHIRFVLDCMRENTTKIRNIKQYLRAVLFNAPSTMGSYYFFGGARMPPPSLRWIQTALQCETGAFMRFVFDFPTGTGCIQLRFFELLTVVIIQN